jgi:hypothetical protein
MAFNNVGPVVWVDESAPVTWWYQCNGGADFGTQFASADIKISDPLNPGAIVVADQQAKQHTDTPQTSFTTYYVRISSIAHGGCYYNLQGGGMT